MQTSSVTTQNAAFQSFAPEANAETQKICLSVVIPIYNDGILAEAFCKELQRVMAEYFSTETLDEMLEVIFVDDGSVNDSLAILSELTKTYRFAKVIQLSRNFGQHIAQSCGYAYASGEYVATSNVDMQDPLYELPRLLDHIRKNNYDYVRGVRRERRDSLIKRFTSWAFFWTFEKFSGVRIPRMPSTMRVMNRLYLNAFNQYTEKVRFEIGLEYWLGFKVGYLEVDHCERSVSKSSYNFNKRATMALNAIVSFSDVPLKIGIYGGCALATIGLFLGVYYLALRFLLPQVLPGFTSIVVILLVSQGCVLMMLGIMGLYIGRILKEVQNRPLFVVRETFNFKK